MSNKCKIMAGLAAAVLAVGRIASADTITVTDYLNAGNDVNLHPVQVGTNSFGAIYQYQYDVNIDSLANIQQNDGFVIYDVNLLTAFDGQGVGSLSLIQGDNTVLTGFQGGLEIVPSTGTGNLQDPSELAGDLPPAHYTDQVGIQNIVYVWTPSTTYVSSSNTDLLLTLYTNQNTPANGFAQGVDFSGSTSGGGKDSAFSVENKPIIVPTSLPTPAAWMGGSALFALLGISRIMKDRKSVV